MTIQLNLEVHFPPEFTNKYLIVMHTSNNGGDSGGAVSLIDYCSIRFGGH